MMFQEIICIEKDDRKDIYTSIKTLGTLYLRYTLEDAIKAVERDPDAFYVGIEGTKVKVIVAKSRFGHKYLKTENDGEEENNLLNLPSCS